MEDLEGGSDTFDFREAVSLEVSSISCLKSALGGVFLKASEEKGTCNDYKAGMSGIWLGKGVWLSLWGRKVLFKVGCKGVLKVKCALGGLVDLMGSGNDGAMKRLEV